MSNLNKEKIRDLYKDKLLSLNEEVNDDDIVFQYILKFLPHKTSIRIMDAGCGNGRYANKLVLLGYKSVSGVDLFDNLNNIFFSYYNASIDNLPFDNDFFDFIYSNSVIYYLEKPSDAVKEFNRVLRENGLVFLTAHTKYSLFTLWRKIKVLLKRKSAEHLKGVKFYSANQYEKIFRQNGFKIIWVDGYKVSMFILPIYCKLIILMNNIFRINLPLPKNRITSNRYLAYLKSIIGYHLILVAKKRVNN